VLGEYGADQPAFVDFPIRCCVQAGKEAFSMQVIGYSERGVLNSRLYEIAYSSAPSQLLSDLVSRMVFPFTESRPPLAEADVLVEQSISDFGDADALILFAGDVTPSDTNT
jgi:hypothetical protein